MKKIIIFLIVLLVLVGCSTTNDLTYKIIDTDEAKTMMVDGNIIIDVREDYEYDAGHIENAISVPLSQIRLNQFAPLDDKTQTILVYCRTGSRAATASKLLAEAGYENVYDFGGINTWPDPLVK